MILPKHVIDDFKTDRKDITPPLPAAARLVPLLFYMSIVAAAILCTVFIARQGIADASKQAFEAGAQAARAEVATVDAEKKALENRILRARDVQAWVEGSMPVQPLAVAIARSMGPGASLASLRLARGEDTPENINFSMSVAATSIDQIERTTTAVAQEDFIVIQPQQSFSQRKIDYSATLVANRVVPEALAAPGANQPPSAE